MNKSILIGGVALFLAAGIALMGTAAGDDDDEEHESRERSLHGMSRGVVPVKNEQYLAECGSCHMAYSPGLLPVASWEKIMGGLENHFGDDASLPDETRTLLTKYLVDNAADNALWRSSARIVDSAAEGEIPVRISETRYFVRKHDEIPARMVTGNPQVKSFANCAACHRNAEQGSFDEHQVRIPGFERAHF